MRDLIVVLAVLTLPQVLPLTLLIGLRAELVFGAPLLGAAIAGLAALLTITVAGTPLVWYVVLVALMNAAALGVLIRRRVPRAVATSWETIVLPLGTVVVVALAVLLPLLPELSTSTLDWDARSIWLLHARWLFAGHDYALAAMGNPGFAFSHADYPPAISGAASTAWQLVGGVNLRIAQLLIACLNGCACALLGCAVIACMRGAGRGVSAAAGLLAGAAIAAASVGVGGVYMVDGYADVLAAGAAASAAVYGLMAPRSRSSLVIAVGAGMLAALTKNEGIVAAAVILPAIAVRYGWRWPLGRREALRIGAAAALLLVAVAAWPVAARLAGAHSDLTSQSNLGGLVHLDATVLARVPPALTALGAFYTLLPLAGAAAVCGALSLRAQRRSLGLGSVGWSWGIMIVTTTVLIVTYAVGPDPIAWWLAHSADRTSMLVQLLLLSELAVWFLVAARTIAARVSERVWHRTASSPWAPMRTDA